MSATSAVFEPAGTTAGARPAIAGWIGSRAFDLTFFTLSPLAGLGIVALALAVGGVRGLYVQLAAFYLVAVPHYMSTYTFFLPDDTLAYYRTRRAAFFGGPIAIAALVLVLMVAGLPAIVQSAVFLWNIWHVSMQSGGILSLYRRLNSGSPTEAAPAKYGLLGVNGAMALWNIDRYPPLAGLLTQLHPAAPRIVSLTALVVGAALLARYLLVLARRQAPMRPPERLFFATSLLLFHPYLWVRDYNLATLGMLMGHFIQYLAIVWLLHRRRYAHVTGGSTHQRILARVSERAPLMAMVFVASGLVFLGSNHLASRVGLPSAYTITWFSLTFIHFYLDGLIWAFRDPFVRKAIGTYLILPTHIAT
ncbi:MAG: hypothetical protein ABJD11_03870 [Gemmatimonadota bacterium]